MKSISSSELTDCQVS